MVEQAYYQTPGHVVAAAVVLPVLDVLVVGLRFYTRRRQRLALQTDDWLTLPAALLVLGLGAGLLTGVAKRGLGYVTPSSTAKRNLVPRIALSETSPEITIASQIEWAFYLMSIPTLGFVKLSFLFLYRRIFCVEKRRFTSIGIMTMIVIITAWAISYFFAHLFACGTNFSAFWGSTISLMTKCVKTLDLLYSLAITDFITDAIIILIPIPLVWRLHLTTGRKLAVSAVFLLGGVAVAASITRLVFISRVFTVGFDPNADEDLTITLTLYWGMIECGLGLFAVCLPTLRFLFRGFSLESMAASIQSVFSLQSIRSHGSGSSARRNKSASKTYNAQDDSSTGSQTHIVESMPKESAASGTHSV